MANTDNPRGLMPVSALGANYCGSVNTYFIPASDATVMAVGDPVRMAGSADAEGVPTIVRADSDVTCGVIIGFKADRDSENITHRAASTARYALVADDPDQLFSVQEDSDGAALTADSVGLNVTFVMGAVDTATGLSGVEIDSSSAATTATLAAKLIRLDYQADNTIGANANWIVKLNNHQLGNATAGV